MTVGFYSPLPPARTGVADYSAALLEGLSRYGRVEVAPARCDVALYHLGNNRLHAAVYRRALEDPGVVVLHDAVLHHFLLGQLGETEYVDEFVYNYGEWNRGQARELWRGRAASASDGRYFAYPMLRRVLERSRAVVVHNREAARAAASNCAGTRVLEIPHLFRMPELPAGGEVWRWRQSLGIAPGTFLLGVFGYLRESKRLATVLEVFAGVRRERPSVALLVAGQFVSSDLERAVAPMLREPGVVRLPYLEEREFWLAAQAVDACVNLRYPAAGETSGISIRLMGLGKPVLVTGSPEYAGFPEDACVRIAPGVEERESLRQHLILLTSMTRVASAIGERGARHIRTHHRVEEVSRKYWDLLCESCT